MKLAGVDDAGRGPVLGPLVIAGVLINSNDLPLLISLKVKDSKLLSPKRREQLAGEITKTVDNWHVVKLCPTEIDRVVETGSRLHKLNRLEACTMARVIEHLKPESVYVDASDVLPGRFKQHIAEEVSFKVNIVSEHKADRTYPIVSAASIIAKVERDREIAEIRKTYGDCGSGYASDQKTISFLEQWIRTHEEYPNFVRKSWKPAKRIKNESKMSQEKLV